ncbi:MAG: MCP four helix bundle domain-containing protein, partial [Methylobacter sp.]|nr:MCP four helix bundle domain-containing protein [Methylobacter sp.]
MKINLPVTDKEYSLTKHDSLVSKTDLSGTITYANEDFIRISGFSKEELVGAFHNIVRHPDMPLEVFEDMWRAVKSGLTWTGVVKNRCKNGDYYWVLTNVTPIYEKGQLAGYLSVRNKASSQQIEDASAAYRLFIAGKAGNLKIKDGKVIKSTLFEKLNIFTHLSIKTRLTFIIGFLSLMMLILGGLGLLGISKSNDGLRTVYEDRTIPMNQLAIIQKLLLTNRLRITGSLNDLTTEVIQKNIDEVNQNTAEINKTWALYIATYLTPEEGKLA